MDVSIFLGKLFGLYFSILGLFMLTHREKTKVMVHEMLKPTKAFILGSLSLFLGLGLVISHNIWTSLFQIVITIICWRSLIKGLALIFYPEIVVKLANKMIMKNGFYWAGWCVLIIGIYLMIVSFLF